MKYFLQKVKHYDVILETVRICNDNENPETVMSNEQLISSKEITEAKAIKFCGKEAIKGE